MSSRIIFTLFARKTSILILALAPFLMMGQEDSYKIQSKELNTQEILQKWIAISKKPLNFRSDDLSDEKFTFSIEGTYSSVSERLYALLGLSYRETADVTIVTKSDGERLQIPETSFKIRDEDGLPLPSAYVFIESLDIREISDNNGVVKLNLLLSGSDTINVEYLGFEDRNITLESLRREKYVVTLKTSSESISEVIITDSKQILPSINRINPRDFPQAGSVDQDVLTIVQSLPGITNPSESFQDLVIRGGTPDQVQFRWNGIRLLQSSHFYGRISSVNPFMVDRLELSKDGYSANAAGTIAGGMHMKSKRTVDSLSSLIHINTLYGNVGFSFPLGKRLSASVALRQSLPASLQSPLFNAYEEQSFQFGKIPDQRFLIDTFNLEEFIRTQTGITFGDRQVSLTYRPNNSLSIHADAIHLDNELTFKTIATEDRKSTEDRLAQSNYGYRLAIKQRWSPHFSSDVDVSSSDYDYIYEETPDVKMRDSFATEQINEVIIRNYALTNEYMRRFFKVQFGLERNEWATSNKLVSKATGMDERLDNDSYEHVVFGAISPRFSDRLLLDLGLRWTAYNKSLNGRKLWEPRLHMKYLATDNFHFHAHYGNYHQYLSKRNFLTPLQADNGFWYLADETSSVFTDFIDITQSRQFGGGIDFIKGIIKVSVDVYQKKIKNIWSSSLDFSIDENPFRVGEIDASGIESMILLRQKNHRVSLSYEYTMEEVFLENIEESVLNPFSQPHRVNLIYGYDHKRFLFTGNYIFASGRPFSQATQLIFEEENVDVVFDDLLAQRVPNYERVDLSIKSKPIGRRVKHSFGAQVTNVLNRNNIIKNQYFINLLASPVELSNLEKRGIRRAYNVFWEMTF